VYLLAGLSEQHGLSAAKGLGGNRIEHGCGATGIHDLTTLLHLKNQEELATKLPIESTF
jgi:hypothetical protein